MKVPFIDLRFVNDSLRPEMENAINSVFKTSAFILGENVDSFEKEYATFNHTRDAIGVSSGLDALMLSLRALNIGPTDEVIVPSNTYIATALAVSNVGARPVFVEPKMDTFNIDQGRISAAINSRTKAIIPVHLYGQACEMSAIMAIANSHDLFVIEDNAQAHGAAFEERLTGSWGHINATSFYPTKNLGALGDAGAITTNDQMLADSVRSLRNYGSRVKNIHDHLGFNNRLDEIQAAILRIKLKRLEAWTKQRQDAAAYYHTQLSGIGDVILPFVHPESTHVYHLFVIRTNSRDDIKQSLLERGIETAIHYPTPPHMQPAYSHLELRKGAFMLAEELATTSLSLPLYPGITEAQQEVVVNGIKAFFDA
ncbi:MAG: DegT/DnrJ/EryC1/StrS family aminotransferase [Flavobacteriales bacterium]|nr:DegT/DnrJ/EryC1/StrS family aminotransferase [Flavobacteriales bacterium]